MTGLRLRAHAKVNLGLKVLGRRPDGYHEIRTVLMSTTLHDTLELEVGGDGFHLEVDDPSLPGGPSNLVWRAVELLSPPLGPGRGLRLRLQKRVPWGAGLGGGSSDAAAALLGVDMLYGLGLGPRGLQRHAEALGSDVPFFLTGGAALLTGRGTEVHPLPDPSASELLIVYPGMPLSTRDVYAQLQESLTLAPETASISGFGRFPADLDSWVRFGNDLEPLATRLCPAVADIRDALRAAGARVSAMTGSGSAVFGIFGDAAQVGAATKILGQAGFQVFPCRTLGRKALQKERIVR